MPDFASGASPTSSSNFTFNLVDEPWIPCMRSAHDAPVLLSLRQVFHDASRLWQVADPSPVVTISIYRLLLAVLHRSLQGPRTAVEWASISEHGAWDTQAVDNYLNRWRPRFDLFDARFPFYQTLGLLVNERTGAASVLTQERASNRNQPLLFDHTTTRDAWLTPAAAARAVLAQQNFAVGGLIGYDSVTEPIANKYTGMAPLLGAAVCLLRGATLFETLMLNWVQYSPADEQPFPFHGVDLPAWERETSTAPAERIPDGYADLLTWQSRRILLVPALSPTGEVVVERAVLMKGYQISPSFERWVAETMITFRKNTQAAANGGQPWTALSLQGDRAVWRDSHSLLQTVENVRTRPKTFEWLSRLMVQGYMDERRTLPLDIYGMIPDQANIDDWRRESLPLPLATLQNAALVERIEQAVTFAESMSRLLRPYAIKITHNGKPMTVSSPLALLAEELLVGTSGRSPDRHAREDIVNSFSAPVRFWAQLDTPFRQFVMDASGDISSDAYGQRQYGQTALQAWMRHVEWVVTQVFRQITSDLDGSGRSLRAVALAQSRFRFCLSALLT